MLCRIKYRGYEGECKLNNVATLLTQIIKKYFCIKRVAFELWNVIKIAKYVKDNSDIFGYLIWLFGAKTSVC